MKVVLSEFLATFLPDLQKNSQDIAEAFTNLGHLVSSQTKIDTGIILDLEIRQNRGDALGYYGLAKDLSVYFNTPFLLPPITPPNTSPHALNIDIASADVIRTMAVKISHLNNLPSPQWLQNFLEYHQTKSINLLVDLTNYITFLYGIPCHAFDSQKSGDYLTWKNLDSKVQFTTLFGTDVSLTPPNLVIANKNQYLSLSFLGGQTAAITPTTKEIILEMSVYNPTRVRQDSHQHKLFTEASVRLEKQLDTELIPQAFNHLVHLILHHCRGQIASKVYDYYPHPYISFPINFDTQHPAQLSGIDISPSTSIDILTRLGCHLSSSANGHQITPPSYRRDIEIEADLTEEVVRFVGYHRIPTDKPLTNAYHTDITPPILTQINRLKYYLVNQGFDEIRSYPVISPTDIQTINQLAPKYHQVLLVKTENNINSELPILRPSLLASLQNQLTRLQNLNITSPIKLFEIDKVFSKNSSGYQEKYSLALYSSSPLNLAFDIQWLPTSQGHLAEIDIDELTIQIPIVSHQSSPEAAIELTKPVISLDVNVESSDKLEPVDIIDHYSPLLGKNLLNLSLMDIFPTANHYRYTLRATYYNLNLDQVKALHFQVFGV